MAFNNKEARGGKRLVTRSIIATIQILYKYSSYGDQPWTRGHGVWRVGAKFEFTLDSSFGGSTLEVADLN